MSLASKKPLADVPCNLSDAERLPTFPLKPHASSTASFAKVGRPDSLANIEGYEIINELGRGGMAIVFKARQLALNRIVALKMVLGGEYREREFHCRFQMEAEAVARLQHPNIIQIFDYSTMSGMFPGESHCPYIAFEYVAGGNLSSRIRGLPQSPWEAARIVETLADAVQYAHSCGIIHRDLKPANVLITADGVPKISDFGLAKLLDDAESSAGLTAAGSILGTPEYMAPEQTTPHSRLGPAVDIYALGIILYELLTGRRPFQGNSALETVSQVCTSEPAPLRSLRRGIPRDLETICLTCLRKEPHRRYASAMALADDLRRLQKGEPIEARPVGPLERAWKWARRYRSLAALVVLIMAVTVLGLPGMTYLWITADQAKVDAVKKADFAQRATQRANENLARAIKAGNEAARLRRDSERREARLALEQGLSLCQRGQVDRGLLWLARSLELHEPFNDAAVERALRINLADWSQQLARPIISLEHYPGRVNAAIFLPDNTAMAATDFFARDYDLRTGKAVSAPIGGPAVNGVTDAFAQVMSLALSPDKQTVALGRSSGVIQFWDIQSKKQAEPILQHKQNVWSVAFCPISDRIAAAHNDDVIVWERFTGERLLTLPHPTTVSQVAFDRDGKTLVTAAWDGRLRLFDAADGALQRELQVQKDRLGALALSADGTRLVVGGREGKAQIFTFPELVETIGPLRHVSSITGAVFSPDGRLIVTCGRDDTARVWDATTGRPLTTLRFSAEVNSVALSDDGRRCLVGVSNGRAHLWDMPSVRQRGPAMEHRFAVDQLHYTDDGQKLVAGCSNAAYVWDVPATGSRRVLNANNMRLHCTHLSADDRSVIVARWDESVWRWSIDGQRLRGPHKLTIAEPADFLAGAASGRLWWVNARTRNTISSVDLASGEPGVNIAHPAGILCLAISPDEKLVASGCQDFQVRLFDAASAGLRLALPHPDRVSALAFSDDGAALATGCRDGAARVWDVATGRLLTATAPQQSPVLAVAFSHDGRLLASGGDRAAFLWDTATGIMLGAPLWHIDAVQAVAFHPRGHNLATACRDGNVRSWSLPAPPLPQNRTRVRTAIELLVGLRLADDGAFEQLRSDAVQAGGSLPGQ